MSENERSGRWPWNEGKEPRQMPDETDGETNGVSDEPIEAEEGEANVPNEENGEVDEAPEPYVEPPDPLALAERKALDMVAIYLATIKKTCTGVRIHNVAVASRREQPKAVGIIKKAVDDVLMAVAEHNNA